MIRKVSLCRRLGPRLRAEEEDRDLSTLCKASRRLTADMNIVFASNTGYVEHLAVAICSLLDHNRQENVHAFVVNEDIQPGTWKQLRTMTSQYDCDLVDVKISDRDIDGLATPHHLTRETYYRLFIPEKLQLSKALYLDADIVVNGPIRELYDIDLDDYCLAAANTPGFVAHQDLEMSEGARYFNAGVMLINLDKWRSEHIKERVIDVVQRKPWAIQFADQCGLNSVMNGQWKEIHPKFNVESFYFKVGIGHYASSFPPGELAFAIKHPVIIHYSGSVKPWHFGYRHPYRKTYWEYLRKTPFNRWFSNDISAAKVVKACIPKRIKEAIKDAVGQTSEGK